MARDYRLSIKQQKSSCRQGLLPDWRGRQAQLERLGRALRSQEARCLAVLKRDLDLPETQARAYEWEPVLEDLQDLGRRLPAFSRSNGQQGIGGAWGRLRGQEAAGDCGRRPWGQVLVLGTAFSPLAQSLRPALEAVAAGNAVLLQVPLNCPATAEFLKGLLAEIFPAEQFSLVCGGEDLSWTLVQEGPDFIYIQGTRALTQSLLQTAAEKLIPTAVRVEGRNPCILAAELDYQQAAQAILEAKLYNMGQSYYAPDHLIVHEASYAPFVEALKKELRERWGVDPSQEAQYQSVVAPEHFARLLSALQSGRIVWGGRANRPEQKLELTLLTDIRPGEAILAAPVYGPILPVFRYRNFVALLQELERLPVSPVAYYYGRDKREQQLFQEHSPAATLVCNAERPLARLQQQVQTACGAAGYGSWGGQEGLYLFSRPQVLVD